MNNLTELKSILTQLNTFYDSQKIGDTENLFSAGALDSLLLIQFVIGVEEKYKIRLKNDDVSYDNFKTFQSISSLVSTYLS